MNFKYIAHTLGILSLLLLLGCQEDDQSFGEIEAPSNLDVTATVVGTTEENPYGDGSGLVNFQATADNVINFSYHFGDNSSLGASSGEASHPYTSTGVNTYTATVIAYGTAGTSTSKNIDVTVLSNFSDPQTKTFLTGDDSKTWYVARNEAGHLGVGPVETATPDFYAAAPNEKVNDPCFYNDELVFSLDADGNIIYNQNNQGATFFNESYLSVGGGSGSSDQCLPFDTSGDFFANLASANSTLPDDLTTGTQIVLNGGAFMSYYIGASNYEILEISDTFMHVRAIMGNDPTLAWYLKFTTNPEGDGASDNELQTEYTSLMWEEEFDVNGAPDPNTWNIETGNNNGWGNQELQYYTEDNVIVEDGILKITAKAENESGFNYTSSRINTLNNFNFKYGRIEVRAKLPSGGGTWPAIWMLGSNFPDVGWPETGEIDIMEHKGNEPGVIHGSLHLPGNFGGDAISQVTTVQDVTEEFKNYTVEWSANRILFAVDDVVFHEYTNSSGTPFNNPFFLILNVAMGGTFGGDVDPDFTESTMEVDYIRVYQ